MPREQVDHDCQVEPAFVGSDVRAGNQLPASAVRPAGIAKLLQRCGGAPSSETGRALLFEAPSRWLEDKACRDQRVFDFGSDEERLFLAVLGGDIHVSCAGGGTVVTQEVRLRRGRSRRQVSKSSLA